MLAVTLFPTYIDLQNVCRIALSKARGPLNAVDVPREKVKKKNYLRGKMKASFNKRPRKNIAQCKQYKL